MAVVEEEWIARSARAMVEQIEGLREEITCGVSAVARNAVPALEDSLHRQEVLCAALKHLLQNARGEEMSDAERIRVRATMSNLLTSSKGYAKVLEQSRASNQLLYALCSRYNETAVGKSQMYTAARYSIEV